MPAEPFSGAEQIETHAATIFLTGDRAWKMKKPVNLGYLDFSTPDKRRRALEAELILNRRTAPDLYLGVHRLTQDARGKTALDGPGEPIDWVLEMRRFPAGALLDEIAAAERLDVPLMLDLADAIASHHDDAPIASGWDSAARLATVIDGNAEQLERLRHVLPGELSDSVVHRQRAALRAAGRLLNQRAGNGRVRRVHGDLHLRNIALVDGRPLLFDCLEFDEALATIDVLYDLAFLLMDLWHRGLSTEANALFNRYLDVSGQDEDGVRLLPLFLSLRATIRAYVEGTRADQGQPGAADAARSYLDLALAALGPRRGRLIAVGGLSGTGKTTLARALGATVGAMPGARVLRTDVLRKRAAGLKPEEQLSPASYTPGAAAHTYGLLQQLAAMHLAAGQAVIVDGAFLDPDSRRAIALLARDARVPFAGLWLIADRDVRLQRVRARQNDASDANEDVVRMQADTAPDPAEQWTLIRAAAAPQDTIAEARAALA